MKNKTIISSIICILLLVLIGLAFTDGHNTNIRYLMWKWGWADYSPEISMRYMTVDTSFKNSLAGMTKAEIMKWFPDLRIETKPNQYLDQSNPFFISTPDFLWIGDTQWAIEFENGKVTGFSLIKGIPKTQDREHFQES